MKRYSGNGNIRGAALFAALLVALYYVALHPHLITW